MVQWSVIWSTERWYNNSTSRVHFKLFCPDKKVRPRKSTVKLCFVFTNDPHSCERWFSSIYIPWYLYALIIILIIIIIPPTSAMSKGEYVHRYYNNAVLCLAQFTLLPQGSSVSALPSIRLQRTELFCHRQLYAPSKQVSMAKIHHFIQCIDQQHECWSLW